MPHKGASSGVSQKLSENNMVIVYGTTRLSDMGGVRLAA